MIKQAFLTREEIKALQVQEAASTKEQKRTPEQIDAIYSSGTNILVSASCWIRKDLCHGAADTGSDAAWHFD